MCMADHESTYRYHIKIHIRQKAKQLPTPLLSTIWELFATQHNPEAGTLLSLCAGSAPSLFAAKLLSLVASPGLEPIKASVSLFVKGLHASCGIKITFC